MKKILVIGSSNIDFIIRVSHMPAVGETVMGNTLDKLPGGKGANQAFACGRLGGNTTFLSVVGSDPLAELIINNMNMAGVDVKGMERTADAPTGLAVVYINDYGNNSIVVVPGANALCGIKYLKGQDKAIEDSDIVVLQMEIPLESVYYVIRRAKELGKTVILNPAPAPLCIPGEIYRLIDFITPNETELQKLSGCLVDTRENLLNAGKILLDYGVGNVLVTLGENGAMLLNGAGVKFFDVPEVKVVDTTAAGDTFNAAFAVKISEGGRLEEAIRFANLASSLAVTKKGAQASVPSLQEVIAFSKSI